MDRCMRETQNGNMLPKFSLESKEAISRDRLMAISKTKIQRRSQRVAIDPAGVVTW